MIPDKKKYLGKKIEPYDPSKVNTVEDALIALQGCSFQGRNLGNALEVMTKMAQDEDCLRVLTLAGAMIPAGMEEIICQGIERGIFGAIVSTGANIIHSIVNSFETSTHQSHYLGIPDVNDANLHIHRINRIYDTYLPEEEYEHAEDELFGIIQKHFESSTPITTTSSKFLSLLGKDLPGRSFINIAAKNNVPIFCGAFSDSELGLNLMKYRKNHDYRIIMDELGDIDNFAHLIASFTKHGTIILGGGVPRNWAQQIFPYLDQMKSTKVYEKEVPIVKNAADSQNSVPNFEGYDYSVRFHTASAYDGGLSGCTISESVSWGKYSPNSFHQSVWVDSTIGFPLIMTALFQRLDGS
ncbi:MAG: deoxyhypusine synthase family protein [Promethearchaeota archaeon]